MLHVLNLSICRGSLFPHSWYTSALVGVVEIPGSLANRYSVALDTTRGRNNAAELVDPPGNPAKSPIGGRTYPGRIRAKQRQFLPFGQVPELCNFVSSNSLFRVLAFTGAPGTGATKADPGPNHDRRSPPSLEQYRCVPSLLGDHGRVG